VYNLNGAYYAVYKVDTDNGLGSLSSVYYLYEGARIHRQGKGLLGFSKLTTTDSFHDYKSLKTFEYNPTFYYSYLKKDETIQSSYNNDTINRITVIDSVKCLGGKRILPYEGQTISVDLLLKTVITATNKYDNYGNLTRSTAIFQER